MVLVPSGTWHLWMSNGMNPGCHDGAPIKFTAPSFVSRAVISPTVSVSARLLSHPAATSASTSTSACRSTCCDSAAVVCCCKVLWGGKVSAGVRCTQLSPCSPRRSASSEPKLVRCPLRRERECELRLSERECDVRLRWRGPRARLRSGESQLPPVLGAASDDLAIAEPRAPLWRFASKRMPCSKRSNSCRVCTSCRSITILGNTRWTSLGPKASSKYWKNERGDIVPAPRAREYFLNCVSDDVLSPKCCATRCKTAPCSAVAASPPASSVSTTSAVSAAAAHCSAVGANSAVTCPESLALTLLDSLLAPMPKESSDASKPA